MRGPAKIERDEAQKRERENKKPRRHSWLCGVLQINCFLRSRTKHREEFLVPKRGLEPPQCCHRQDLNLVRLPIPPPGQGVVRCTVALCSKDRNYNSAGAPVKHFMQPDELRTRIASRSGDCRRSGRANAREASAAREAGVRMPRSRPAAICIYVAHAKRVVRRASPAADDAVALEERGAVRVTSGSAKDPISTQREQPSTSP